MKQSGWLSGPIHPQSWVTSHTHISPGGYIPLEKGQKSYGFWPFLQMIVRKMGGETFHSRAKQGRALDTKWGMKDYHTLPHPTCPHSLRGAFRLQLLAPKMTSFGIDFEFFTRSRFRRVRVRSHPGIELWGWNSGGGWHLASPLRYPKEVKIPFGLGALARKIVFASFFIGKNRLRAIFDLSG